jgi:hypothetical protein
MYSLTMLHSFVNTNLSHLLNVQTQPVYFVDREFHLRSDHLVRLRTLVVIVPFDPFSQYVCGTL